MAYPCRYSIEAKESIRNCVDYLLYEVGSTGNSQAAENFINDLGRTIEMISNFGKSFALCEEPEFRNIEQRKVHFPNMRYKVFYHIDKDIAYIDLVCHDLQDYNPILQ